MRVLQNKDVNVIRPSYRGKSKSKAEPSKVKKNRPPKTQNLEECFEASQNQELTQSFCTPRDLIEKLDSEKLQQSPRKPNPAVAPSTAPAEVTPSRSSHNLTQYAIDQLQYRICEKEMEVGVCGHPFCHALRAVKLPLNEFRNLLLFEFEMIPPQSELELRNLRDTCYAAKVYGSLLPDWRLKSGIDPEDNSQDFMLSQLFIGMPSEKAINSETNHAWFGNSDRVSSRRSLMPNSSLALRNRQEVFKESVNPAELLKDSSPSDSFNGDDQLLSPFPSHHHGKLNCILKRDQREMNPQESRQSCALRSLQHHNSE
ncbi:Mam1p [Lachancea thermotolerans CBS 6340]|uniref:KLTH0C06446p n=1 Tax=Lachancea thermotolerans (strain ATCC 56472 / CBS 6340 / NRRL Y-8284) TaxID=559295 RepID=C5DE57_LACTC|nr:KLTH0C06446p [Lachancea thermotolerans CBS 6340]CAR22068.1 KLTH0C06446p [Lachancea thermotolerans CBS 6340]